MTKRVTSKYADLWVDADYWCRSMSMNTEAVAVRMSPHRNVYENRRGQKKKIIFRKSRIYDCVRVHIIMRDGNLYRWKTVLRDEHGDVWETSFRRLFVQKEEIRNQRIDEIIGIK